MTAGAKPGSGFDLTIRAVVDALQKDEIVTVPMPVQNRPGRIGADFLATMVEKYGGHDDQVSVTSLSMMMNQLHGISPYGYTDVTMIARLMTEYYVVVTAPETAYRSLDDVMAAIKADPGVVQVAAATDDRAPFDLLVSAAGGDPATVDYVPFEGGGEQTAALLAGDIEVAIGGVSEFVETLTSKRLTALGVLSEQRLPGLDAPTAREQGLDVTLSNWRGLLRPSRTCRTSPWRTGTGARRDGPVTDVAADRPTQPVHHDFHGRHGVPDLPGRHPGRRRGGARRGPSLNCGIRVLGAE